MDGAIFQLSSDNMSLIKRNYNHLTYSTCIYDDPIHKFKVEFGLTQVSTRAFFNENNTTTEKDYIVSSWIIT